LPASPTHTHLTITFAIKKMNTLQAIFTRRSIRKYTQQHISKEIITEIIRAATYAPSACNKQPWHFIVINEQKILNEIPKFHPQAKFAASAPCAIVVCGNEDQAHDRIYWPIDCGAATQNILLAAHDLNLGACWCGIYPRQNRIDALRELLKLPQNIHPFSLVTLGFPDETPAQPNRFNEEMIKYNQW
jgi:nitroreductase